MHSSDGSTVAVVGSIHLDVQFEVPRLPGPGETVLGTGHSRGPGGKGANQAVAAAVTGSTVSFVGRVGDDSDGVAVRRAIEAHDVATDHMQVDGSSPTGLAFITVDPSGANQIAVSPGASGRLSASDVEHASTTISSADTLLLQMEVPIEAIDAAAGYVDGGTTVVLNPAPARELPRELLARVHVLTPNLVELQQLSGRNDLDTTERIAAAARDLPHVEAVVVTLGREGAIIIDRQRVHYVPGERVNAVDSTGAGDAFCGALASAIATGHGLETAVRSANRFAAMSTTRRGALNSYARPTALT